MTVILTWAGLSALFCLAWAVLLNRFRRALEGADLDEADEVGDRYLPDHLGTCDCGPCDLAYGARKRKAVA